MQKKSVFILFLNLASCVAINKQRDFPGCNSFNCDIEKENVG